MRSKLTLLFCLALLALTTAITEPWPDTDRKTWPIGGEAACETNFCNCPEAAAALLCQDFEDGESDCAVSKAYGSLNLNDALLGEIGYVLGAPDCADATSPLDGSYSFEGTTAGGADSVSYWPENAQATVSICENNVDCTLTALLNIQDDEDTATTSELLGFDDCRMKYRSSTNTLRVFCDSGSSIVHTLTEGVTYKICLQYTQDDDCTLHVDPADGTYCAGTLGTSTTELNCNGGAHQAMESFGLNDGGDLATVNIDNVLVVNE